MELDFDATTPQIRTHPSRNGVRIVDPIQEAQFTLLTPDPVEPLDCDTDRFYFPADAAATLATDTVETPYLIPAWVRDESGAVVAEINEQDSVTVPPGQYTLELLTTQVKLQIAVEGGIEAESLNDRVRFEFSGSDTISVGARSLHEQPAATVTTTDDPGDVMAAVSTLGSALKTTTAERAFPTLRGHPPLVERGDELSVPAAIDAPDTDVEIEVPPSLEFIYPVTSLAYYLGATLAPGPEPRIVADDWTYSLDGEGGFEATVERTLKQVFLLDCVTRTEGYYQVDLHERRAVEQRVDLDWETLYERSTAEQLQAYLDVPYDRIADAVPKWKLTVDVRPDPEYVSALPFLANELAVIRCPVAATPSNPTVEELNEQVESFFRDPAGGGARRGPGTLVRGTRSESLRASSTASLTEDKIFRPPGADSIEQAYIGDGIPVGASKMTVDSYYRRLEYEPSDDPRIRVVVVCNDEQMTDENVVSDIYGTREWIDFDIEIREQLTSSQLRELLTGDIDFLHYIGHVDEEGIRCTDGYLDTQTLSAVNVSAFLLNACDSYEQGRGLVDHGAMAGIATISDIVNEAATSVGRTVAQLLNQGFSLAATHELIKEYEQIGHHYIVVGDASVSVVKTESGTPYHAEVEKTSDQNYDVSLHGYPRLDSSLGTLFTPFLNDTKTRYLNTGEMCSEHVTDDELREFLLKQDVPVITDSTLHWSGNFLSRI